MYLLSRLDPTRYNYNVVEVAVLKGPVDVTALSASLTAVCARHEALRSIFIEGEWRARRSACCNRRRGSSGSS